MKQRDVNDANTDIAGLDDILKGGFERNRTFLIEGSPGAGKTTLALQFLLAGARRGERCLYITLAETEDELRATAVSHGWSLAGVEVCELVPPESLLDEEQQQSLLYSSDLELGETVKRILDVFQRAKPDRVVLDSLSEIRLLAQSSLRYRRQILALKHFFAKSSVTVLMLDDLTTEVNDRTVHSVAHGVLRLEELLPEYGAERRRLRVVKYRGRQYRGGFHDFAIKTGGVRVFPRLVSAEHAEEFDRSTITTGSAELDSLLGGGIAQGSSVLLLGPAGTGKSLVALSFAAAAVRRGERAAMFIFDEDRRMLIERAGGLGIDLAAKVAADQIVVEQVHAAELAPGEFAERVRHCVDTHGARTVIIDSVNGYQAAMPGEQELVLHMNELLQYLGRRGVTTFLTVGQHGLIGTMQTPIELTYLADTVIVLRYFEATGCVRRAISVVKKRSGMHENTIREFEIGADGIAVGDPLSGFQGILRGVPELRERTDELMDAYR